MTRWNTLWPMAAIALAAMTVALPAAADHEKVERKIIKVKKYLHDCEGDDCPDSGGHRRVIVIGDHGEMHQVDGGDVTWSSPGGDHTFVMPFHGKGAFLGVAGTELTRELRLHFGVPEDAGVLVAKVVEDSAAARAGIQVGDILTAVNGESVVSNGGLIRTIHRLEPGAAVDLEVYRDGTLQSLGATLGERQRSRRHAMLVHCGDDDEDCPGIAHLDGLDCADDSDCEISIECADGDCDCTVNGETRECETLPGFEAPGE